MYAKKGSGGRVFQKDACTAERDRCGSAWQCDMLSFPKFSKTHVTKTTRSVLPTLSFLSDLSHCSAGKADSLFVMVCSECKGEVCRALPNAIPHFRAPSIPLACAAPFRVRFRSDLACRERGQVCS